jgi:hypothetical protein
MVLVMGITPEQLAASGTEHGHQAALFCWSAINTDKYPDLKWLFAIPNGGFRDKITAGRLKSEGVKAGVPDICLLVRRGPYAALWIELKRPKSKGKAKGRVQNNQSPWLNQANECGHGAIVCYGWEHARDILISYLDYK